jgi:hypothetical protein
VTGRKRNLWHRIGPVLGMKCLQKVIKISSSTYECF